MALTRVFNAERTSQRVESTVKRWPEGAATLKFQLDDTLFNSRAERVRVTLQCSWDGGATWPWTDSDNVWTGGTKARDGAPHSCIVGPFKRGTRAQPLRGEVFNPTHVRFFIEPVAGTPTVGLMAEATEL